MIFYQTPDGAWHPAQAAAKAADGQFRQVGVPTDKPALLEFLNKNCGAGQLVIELPTPLPQPESYAEKSVRFDDEFDAMPVTLQLHYAAKAMENARDHLS